MKCKKCGADLINGDKFCQNCGAPMEEEHSNIQNNNGMNGENPNNQNFNNGMNMGYPNNQGFNNINGYGFNGQMQGQVTNGYKNNTALILTIVGIVVGGIVLALVLMFIGKKSSNERYPSYYNSSNNYNDSAQTVSSNNYKTYLGSFELEIPTNIMYEKEDGALLLYDSSDSWVIKLEIIDQGYAQLKSNMGLMKSSAESQGMTITEPAEKNQNGVNFITFETVEGGYNELCAYAKADNNNSFGFSVIRQDNKIDYSMLNKVTSIISSAKNTGVSSNSIKLDVSQSASKKIASVK